MFLCSAASFDDGVYLACDLWQVFAQFGQNRLDLPDKDASVPDVVSVAQIALSGCQIRLLHEALSRKRRVSVSLADRIGETDVAIAGFGRRRFDANCDQASLFGQFIGQRERPAQALDVGDHRVGAERRHYRLRVVAGDHRRCPGDGGRGVPSNWLAQNVVGGNRRQVLLNEISHSAPRNHPGLRGRRQWRDAGERLLNHAISIGQRQKLFGKVWRTEWPEARPAPTRQYNSIEMLHC